MTKRKIEEGDTWEFIDLENGNRGVVWLQELWPYTRGDHWKWYCHYSDGSHGTGSFDWATSKRGAVDMCATKLIGMGSLKTRFKFNPKLKYGLMEAKDAK